MQQTFPISEIIVFLTQIERLKTTLRHSYTSDATRKESVAEHSYQLVVLLLMITPYLQKKIDVLKAVKLAVIHDVAESMTGDIPAFETSKRQDDKVKTEANAMQKIFGLLPTGISDEYLQLWHEYEGLESQEAKFVHALDKTEVLIQHNIASIETWDENDRKTNPYYKNEVDAGEPVVRQLKDFVNEETIQKLKSAGYTV